MGPLPAARSYWEATARPGPNLHSLGADHVTDVAIVGGGFTGLAIAHYLAKVGIATAVLEQAQIGWGASGRNAGSMVPRYKKGFAELARTFGDDRAKRLYRAVHDTLEAINDIIEEYGIECSLRRSGQLTAVHRPAGLQDFEEDIGWLRAVAGDTAMRLLSAAEVRDELATDCYFGGCLEPRGMAMHPLNYARGFARGLAARNVPIFTSTEVTRIVAERDWLVLETGNGAVRAKRAVMGTNAYTPKGLVPGSLERRIIPVCSSILVTKPALVAGRPVVNPARRQFTDTKRLINYGYTLDDGRVLFGGRGDISGRQDVPSVYAALEHALADMFPQLDAKIEYRWSGMVAMTLDHLPHAGRLHDRIFYALGYGGRGVVLSHLLGKAVADLIRGEPVDLHPLTGAAFPPIPLHGLRIPIMKAAAGWLSLRDRLERAPGEQPQLAEKI